MVAPSLAEAARRLKPRPGHRLPALVLMTDRERLPDPVAAIRTLPRGSLVVARDTDADGLRRLAFRIAPLCRACRVRLLVASDWRLARAAGAAGLHLSEGAARHGDRRWRQGRRRGWLVTAAAHSPSAVRRAAALGVDAVFISPVFITASHPGQRPIGALRFTRWACASPVPVFALGGIDGGTARRLSQAGAAGFAAIGALTPARQADASSTG